MRVCLDGAEVVDIEVPFSFHGGYVFFSGSTGTLTSFHSFDDLEILHQCG